MLYGYARVSTLAQKIKGNSLEEQERELYRNGAERIYKDSYTGSCIDRPNLQKLLQEVISGDTIIVTRLDRLARNTIDGVTLVEELLDANINVHVLNMGMIDNTPTGHLIMTVMLAFAQFEKDLILQRTMEGKAIARQKPDYQEGRPRKYTQKQLNHAIELLSEYSYNQVAQLTGISVSTIAREVRRRKLA